MLKHIRLYIYAALVGFATVGTSAAQTSEKPKQAPIIQWSQEQIEGTKYESFGTAEDGPGATRPVQTFLTDIVNWLSTNFGLPAIHDYPRVELAPAAKLTRMRYTSLLPDQQREDSTSQDSAGLVTYQREVIAVYNDTMRTIFVSDAWAGTSAAELSVLVHEMVHHLQNLGKLEYECPAARERLAYEAQDQWLKRFGRDLETAFEIDALTLRVTSACMN